MGKYRITLLYLVISALTIGMAAFALNRFAAHSAEENLVNLTRDQSARDAALVAEVINQFLEDDADAPGANGDISVAPEELLNSLRIVDIRLFDVSGDTLWSSANPTELETQPRETLLSAAIGGEIASGLATDVAVTVGGEVRSMDLVETYLPLLPAGGGAPVGVVGVYRNVTGTLETHVAEAREAVLKIVLLSLSAVFTVLLIFVSLANRHVFLANARRVEAEKQLKERISREKAELERVGELKNRFLSSITHELMTPLTPVSALTDVMLKNRAGNLSESDVSRLQTIRRNVGRLHAMLRDLLQLSLMDSGEYQLNYSKVNLGELIAEAVETFSPLLAANQQELALDVEKADRVVELDEQRITQVVTTLLGNAVKYSQHGGTVRVVAEVDEENVTVSVIDQGFGISSEDQAELFTKFYRADNRNTREVSGTGIGLVTCKQIVDLHGGEIRLDSEPGRGTTVTFSVPAHAPAQARPGASHAA